MSAFMLRKMIELIEQGVKTDKGFKDLNQVARNLSEHYGLDISGTQVYNHLRKWRSRWMRITRLKDLSGALWDDQNNMIVLEKEHYMGHTMDKPKDVEFLNVPIENYTPMSIIFGNGQATGRFAMGSNEPLGAPADMSDSGLGVMDGDMEGRQQQHRGRKGTAARSHEHQVSKEKKQQIGCSILWAVRRIYPASGTSGKK
ncbi:hypothetical protein E2562_026725 [Oryza meyeriana var. granulata]|uniref:Myb/SANT-like domain-containing protein n=1 Tax=Oryza meyeriana var. granulata TaxID=110450 RepID=A0A6G1EZ56_9ORYZ|nr:hypothetical protein E2562_026725 [Oryza meyeriana var. granulata]